MLTENDIIEKTSEYLQKQNYTIIQSLNTEEKGIDIIAEKNDKKLYIEAKGETSSKRTSVRFGKAFSKNQVKTHVAVAILAAMKQKELDKSCDVAIALPNNENHVELINSIKASLKKADIKVFIVDGSGVKII